MHLKTIDIDNYGVIHYFLLKFLQQTVRFHDKHELVSLVKYETWWNLVEVPKVG